MPGLLGADDDWSGFVPHHPVLAELLRRYPHARLGRTGLLLEALVPAIIEQKVTGQEAFAGFRMLVHRYGERAPGPGVERQAVGAAGAGHAAHDPVVGVAAAAHRPGPLAHDRHRGAGGRHGRAHRRLRREEADRRLRSIPGIGRWTTAEVRQRTFGDPDAVSFGDYHVAKDVGWALTGEPFDDDELEEFLEPYRPQRGRVPALLGMARLHRPRHGPRMAPRQHLPVTR